MDASRRGDDRRQEGVTQKNGMMMMWVLMMMMMFWVRERDVGFYSEDRDATQTGGVQPK